ncbi:hypothetical protein K438DRAFT_1985717 [Mycena galopus ATCC 62051]|nr:hypothetical protein K438DRAFT_1985717 [Mycena galopus ATCC 62051]
MGEIWLQILRKQSSSGEWVHTPQMMGEICPHTCREIVLAGRMEEPCLRLVHAVDKVPIEEVHQILLTEIPVTVVTLRVMITGDDGGTSLADALVIGVIPLTQMILVLDVLKYDNVPTWDGNADTIVRWLLKINDIARESSTVFKQLGRVVPKRLTGEAEVWYWSLPMAYRSEIEQDWDTLRKAFSTYYIRPLLVTRVLPVSLTRADSGCTSASATSITVRRANSAPISVAVAVAPAPSPLASPVVHGSPLKALAPTRVGPITIPLPHLDPLVMDAEYSPPLATGALPSFQFGSSLRVLSPESLSTPAVAPEMPPDVCTRCRLWCGERFVSRDRASARRRRCIMAAGVQVPNSFAGRRPFHEHVRDDRKDPSWRIDAHPANAGRSRGYTAFRTSASARSALVFPY